MTDSFSQSPQHAPVSNGVQAEDALKPPPTMLHLAGRRITAFSFTCAFVISVVALRPVNPAWQLLVERLLIYFVPVMTLVAAYFFGQRAHQARTSHED